MLYNILLNIHFTARKESLFITYFLHVRMIKKKVLRIIMGVYQLMCSPAIIRDIWRKCCMAMLSYWSFTVKTIHYFLNSCIMKS